MTVVAILAGLQTLVIPILMKIQYDGEDERETLVLKKVHDEIYRDSSGQEYEVTLLNRD